MSSRPSPSKSSTTVPPAVLLVPTPALRATSVKRGAATFERNRSGDRRCFAGTPLGMPAEQHRRQVQQPARLEVGRLAIGELREHVEGGGGAGEIVVPAALAQREQAPIRVGHHQAVVDLALAHGGDADRLVVEAPPLREIGVVGRVRRERVAGGREVAARGHHVALRGGDRAEVRWALARFSLVIGSSPGGSAASIASPCRRAAVTASVRARQSACRSWASTRGEIRASTSTRPELSSVARYFAISARARSQPTARSSRRRRGQRRTEQDERNEAGNRPAGHGKVYD